MKNKISAAFFTVVMAATMLAAVSVSGCGEVEPPPVVTPPYVPDAPAVTDPGDEEGSLHAADGYDYYVHWVKSGDNYIYGRINVPEYNEFLGVEVGREYVTSLVGLDIYEELTKYENEIVIYHGDKDGIVPLSASIKADEAYPNCELHIIENGYHGFRPSQAYEISLDIDRWIRGLSD